MGASFGLLPERLSEADISLISSHMLDKVSFNKMKDESGTISKDDFLLNLIKRARNGESYLITELTMFILDVAEAIRFQSQFNTYRGDAHKGRPSFRIILDKSEEGPPQKSPVSARQEKLEYNFVDRLKPGVELDYMCPELRYVFIQFCPTGEMTSQQFIKMMKDTKLLNNKFTSGDADLLFAKAKLRASGGGSVAPGQKVSYYLFTHMIVPAIAEKRGETVEDLTEYLSYCEGPIVKSTQVSSQVSVSHNTKLYSLDSYDYTVKEAMKEPLIETKSGASTPVEKETNTPVVTTTVTRLRKNSFSEKSNANNPFMEVPPPYVVTSSPRRTHSIKVKLEDMPSEELKRCMEEVRVTFIQFCPTGEMTSQQFMKMMKDTSLIGRKFTPGDADLIFTSAKAKASRQAGGTSIAAGQKVNFDTFFEVAIPAIAERRGETIEEITATLGSAEGPLLRITQALPTRLHDDKSTYSGTYGNGGGHDARIDNAPLDLAQLIDRSLPSNSVPINLSPTAARNGSFSPRSNTEKKSFYDAALKSAIEQNLLEGQGTIPEIRYVFIQFCPFAEMSYPQFSKMIRDANLINQKLKVDDLYDIFHKGLVKYNQVRSESGNRNATTRINFMTFCKEMIPEIAMRREQTDEDIVSYLGMCEGPIITANYDFTTGLTVGDFVEDSPLPMNGIGNRAGSQIFSLPSHDLENTFSGGINLGLRRQKSMSTWRRESIVKRPVEDDTIIDSTEAVKYTFNMYCSNGEMTSQQFMKLVKDTNLLNKKFLPGDADLIFTKSKGKASKKGAVEAGQKVNFATFSSFTIPAIAEKRGETEQDIITILANADGPLITATRAQASRLHDDKSYYPIAYSSEPPVTTGELAKMKSNSNFGSSFRVAAKGGATPRGGSISTPKSRSNSINSPRGDGGGIRPVEAVAHEVSQSILGKPFANRIHPI